MKTDGNILTITVDLAGIRAVRLGEDDHHRLHRGQCPCAGPDEKIGLNIYKKR